jgi:ubiquinone/menaquinone biosynthesis C-methylase UbiE
MELRKKVKEANIRYSEELCRASVFDKPGFTIPERKRIRGNLKKISRPEGSLLDLACGHGEFSRIAEKYFAKVFCLDISRAMLLLHPSDNPRIQGDVERIPFRDGTFDAVVTSRALHHLVDCKYIFNEIHRILKKDGVYYLEGEPNKYIAKGLPTLVKGIRHFLKERPFYIWRYHDLAEYNKNNIDPDSMAALLKESGFRKVDLGFHWTECSNHLLARLTNFLAVNVNKKFGYRIYAYAWK